jgi:signal peptidase II
MPNEAGNTTTARIRRSPKAFALCVAALALCTLGDLWTKDWAMQQLSRAPLSPPGPVCAPSDTGYVYFQRLQQPPIVLVEDYLELRYAENCGAAFGVLNHGPSWLRLALFAPAAIAATLGLLWLFFSGYGGKLFAISVPLIASGALGNLIDRFRFGFVVDFIRFHVHDSFVWPTFNVADSTISVGVALLLIEGFIAPKTNGADATNATKATNATNATKAATPSEASASAAAKPPR